MNPQIGHLQQAFIFHKVWQFKAPGATPLHKAVAKGHGSVALLLIAQGAAVDVRDNKGRTPLHWAAYNGYSSVAELLLAKCAAVNIATLNGSSLSCQETGDWLLIAFNKLWPFAAER